MMSRTVIQKYKIKLYHHGDVRDKIIVSKKSKTDDVYKIKLYHHGDVGAKLLYQRNQRLMTFTK
jgi:hypothetical protein